MRLALVILLVTVACGGPPRVRAPIREYPGALVPSEELRSLLGESFALDQQVTSESEHGRHEFRAVLQRRAGELVLVGLGPHGGRGFVLTQRGTEIDFESHLPEELPFPPRYMLLDVQRTFFRGLGGVREDGEHRETIDGEEVVERWSQGRLRSRIYRRAEGELRIEYEGGMGEASAPTLVRLDNGFFGYRLTIRTLGLTPVID